jgi:hypothetical protein
MRAAIPRIQNGANSSQTSMSVLTITVRPQHEAAVDT